MKGILIGHANNDVTGVTAILAPKGAVGGVSVRGGAPGTRETDLLRAENMVDKIHAVMLCGGSAFGLDACSGAVEYLYQKGCGFNTIIQKVPIVCGAVLFDLHMGKLVFPDKAMGYEACKNAAESGIKSGRIGAGKGATTGKIKAPFGTDRGGIGYADIKLGKTEIAAIVAVNALGDVYDHTTGKIIAGARRLGGAFLDTKNKILSGEKIEANNGTNTTIGAVITNAKLTKAQANKLADIAHDGLAQSIKPVHTMLDGDTIFAMATGEVESDFNMICVAAVEAVSRAITKAVTE